MKKEILKDFVKKYNYPLIAFSGGVDSTLLVAVCKEVFGDKFKAVIANVASLTDVDYNSHQEIKKLLDINIIEIAPDQFSVPEFKNNTKDRCYYCKQAVFTAIKGLAKDLGCDVIFDGTNADDGKGYRPGIKATEELGIVSPLKECNLTKQDVRELSKEYNLPTFNKPSESCFASRIPYNETITTEKINIIRTLENYLHEKGFTQVRCALHSDLLRVDVNKSQVADILTIKEELIEKAKGLGLRFVTLDLEGFRSGKFD